MEPGCPAPARNARLARTQSLDWYIVNQKIGSKRIIAVAQFK